MQHYLAAAFQHEKAVFPVSAAMVGMFALQVGLFRNGRLLFPAIAAFVGASFGLSTFATGVCGLSVLPDMQLVSLATAAVALLYPGVLVDRYQRGLFMPRHQPEAPARECIGSASLALRVSVPTPSSSEVRERSSTGRMADMNSHEFSYASANKLCRRVSLGLTLLLAAIWCPTAFMSIAPAELIVAEGLLFLLLVFHALVWQSTKLAEFAWGTLNGAHQIAWPCSVLIVVWAFDAARRFASPVLPETQLYGWPGRPVRAAGSRSDKKQHHTVAIGLKPIRFADRRANRPVSLVPRLCLRTHCQRGSASRAISALREAEPRMAPRYQAEPGNEAHWRAALRNGAVSHKLRPYGEASCRFATRPVLRTRPGHPDFARPSPH